MWDRGFWFSTGLSNRKRIFKNIHNQTSYISVQLTIKEEGNEHLLGQQQRWSSHRYENAFRLKAHIANLSLSTNYDSYYLNAFGEILQKEVDFLQYIYVRMEGHFWLAAITSLHHPTSSLIRRNTNNDAPLPFRQLNGTRRNLGGGWKGGCN